MENENKDKAVLNEEELKEVAGGAAHLWGSIAAYCKALNMKKCYDASLCKWEDGICVEK